MGNTKNKPLSPIKEGGCPHCGANLTFSESERRGGEKIKCPKCGKDFEINEVKEVKKKGKGCLVAIIVFVGLVFIGVIASVFVDEGEGELEGTGEQEIVEQTEDEQVEVREVEEEEKEENPEVEEGSTPEYPRLTEETMDRDLVLSCEGGDEVVLWDLPTSAREGAKSRDRVPCGTYGWAFNQYYNDSLGITFYAINTLDERVDNAYGWVTEDLITWRD